ncbi:MAG: serine hydrolase domain-containing protein [Pseudomonadales bacterium]
MTNLARVFTGTLLALLALHAYTVPYSVPTPATDPVMARNMKAAAATHAMTDLAWRQPRAAVAGNNAVFADINQKHFPSTAALTAVQDYSDAHGGKGLLVWYNGQLVARHFAENITDNTHFSGFSMHKSVLALTVLAAIEDGIIGSLDDPIGRYLSPWKDDPRGEITLRQLLQQSSGLAHYTFSSGDPRAAALGLSSAINKTALQFPLTHPPGTHFNYNNVNAQLAGMLLEQALQRSGRTYAEYLSKRLWRPLNNNEASLWLDDEGGSPRYFAGLHAGLADWLRIGIMLAGSGEQVLSQESLAAFSAPSDLNAGYGLNVWLGGNWQPGRRYGPTTAMTVPHAEPYLAPDVVFFDGFGGQRVYVVPSAGLVVARFGEIDMDYDDSIIVNTLLRGLIDANAQSSRKAYAKEASEGVYNQRFEQLLRQARDGSGLSGYDPMVPVLGANEIQKLARSKAAWLDEETRSWLSELGASSNTQALMVWHQSEVIFEEYFKQTDPTSLVVSRSLSKPLSVIAVGRAIQQGFIENLDQTASRYLQEWQDTDKAEITLRQLLQMRSGLAPQANSAQPDDVMNRAYLHPYHIEVILQEYPLVTQPGTRYDYSNANAELIAPIIERATGRRYEQWLSEAVLRPLGAAGGDIWVNRIGGTAHSGCCARLPAETYLRLALLQLQDGIWQGERLLPEGYVQQIVTPTATNPHAGMGAYVAGPYVEGRGAGNPDYQYGKTKHAEPYLDRDLYLFDGNANQVIYIIPKHDLVVLRVGAAPPKDQAWDNSVLPNRILRELSEATGVQLIPQREH